MNRLKIYKDEQKNDEACKELAKVYLKFIEEAKLDKNYIYAKDLAKVFGFTQTRSLRKVVEDVLHLYLAGYLDKVIVGTRHGYTYTDDVELLYKQYSERYNQCKSMISNCYYMLKRIRNGNLSYKEFKKQFFNEL